MITTPTISSNQPTTDLPLKNRIPIPKISGTNDRPKVLYPPIDQKLLATTTRLTIRYAPAIAITRPRKNSAIPPGVPPAPRTFVSSFIVPTPPPSACALLNRNVARVWRDVIPKNFSRVRYFRHHEVSDELRKL